MSNEYRPLPRPLATGSHLLLVGANSLWSRMVRAVAQEVGGVAIDSEPSGRAALSRLLDPQSSFTHVLVNPARIDGLLLAILGLTCDEKASGAEMFLLGRAADIPSHICVIAGPTRAAIWSALAYGCLATPPRPPSVAVLRAALAERRIETRYQPVVRLADATISGVEALARLHRAGERLVGPDQFVPRIEGAGMAAEFTRLVAGRSFADIASPALAPYGLRVALNIPLDVMVLPAALDHLSADRQDAGIDAGRVVIELTESRVVSDLRQLGRVVEQLRREGYSVAIDDISPAISNHEALLDIPFTSVKIDKNMVSRSAVPGAAADFFERIVAAAKARGMWVVVEGVEDMQAWRRVRRAGADLAQGFIIGRPMPATVLPIWIEAWRAKSSPLFAP